LMTLVREFKGALFSRRVGGARDTEVRVNHRLRVMKGGFWG